MGKSIKKKNIRRKRYDRTYFKSYSLANDGSMVLPLTPDVIIAEPDLYDVRQMSLKGCGFQLPKWDYAYMDNIMSMLPFPPEYKHREALLIEGTALYFNGFTE